MSPISNRTNVRKKIDNFQNVRFLGPLVYNAAGPTPMLYGVVSWGNGCGNPDYPGIYTKVAAYRDWINNCN